MVCRDLDPKVQEVINRIQPFENVQRAALAAREAGFTSVNFDLIYGLPLQTLQSIEDTINRVITLMPERIAFYSYAHTPWTSKGQRLFDEKDLPATEDKLNLYIKGREMLMAGGYYDIGMDHFALPQDELVHGKTKWQAAPEFYGLHHAGQRPADWPWCISHQRSWQCVCAKR
jgi:oxygen-independent coproporphyrinogen-3 oxidase